MSSKALSRQDTPRRAARLVAAIAVVGAALFATAGATLPDGRPTPTGLEVPRWVSLKSSHVRARSGPGLDYRILWEYRAAGLPVQVIAETREWRKICDPETGVAWIHRSVASPRRSGFNEGAAELPLHAGRSSQSPVRARLSPHALAPLDHCRDGWCRIGGRKVHGWAPASAVFGGQTTAQCDARRRPGAAPSA